jgi:hypothetical protein
MPFNGTKFSPINSKISRRYSKLESEIKLLRKVFQSLGDSFALGSIKGCILSGGVELCFGVITSRLEEDN